MAGRVFISDGAIGAESVETTGTKKVVRQTSPALLGAPTINGSPIALGTTPTGANPSASLGLTAVNGAAATFMRSDAAPALSQAIVPTWSALHTFTLAPVFSSATINTAAAFDAAKQLVSVTNTGTGNNVLSASPTFTGTIAAASQTLSGLLTVGTTLGVTGVATFTAAPVFNAIAASSILALDGAKQLIAAPVTGTLGSVVLSTNPTIVDTQEIIHAATDATSPTLKFSKARGTVASPTTVVNGDELMYIQGSAYTNVWHTNVGAIAIQIDAAVVAGQRPANRIVFRTGLNNAGGPSDRMQVLSGGCVFIGVGTPETQRTLHVVNAFAGGVAKVENTNGGGSAGGLNIKAGDNSTTGSKMIGFNRPDDTEIGTVKQNAAGTVQYNTSSDKRLKENIRNLGDTEGTDLVNALKPRTFNFIGDMEHEMRGFVAQEVYKILPEVVSVGSGKSCKCDLKLGGHVEKCFRQDPWGMDYGKLTPILVKAVQELSKRLALLER